MSSVYAELDYLCDHQLLSCHGTRSAWCACAPSFEFTDSQLHRLLICITDIGVCSGPFSLFLSGMLKSRGNEMYACKLSCFGACSLHHVRKFACSAVARPESQCRVGIVTAAVRLTVNNSYTVGHFKDIHCSQGLQLKLRGA